MIPERTTLHRFLRTEGAHADEGRRDLQRLVLHVAGACKAISRRLAFGALKDDVGPRSRPEDSGKDFRSQANDLFLRGHEAVEGLAGIASEAMDAPASVAGADAAARHLLVFDPLDGSPDVGLGVPVGSLFSVFGTPEASDRASASDFLQPGTRQLCAGYAIYGPFTMLVLTLGAGVHGFTLDPHLDGFVLTHPSLQIPAATREFAIDASHSRFWEPAVKRYVDECVAGTTGPRREDFTMRWIASPVAELHRTLLRGGVFLDPSTRDDPPRVQARPLLYDAHPVSYLVEQAGGLATTGTTRVLEMIPQHLQEKTGLVFGSREEVERIERYHRDRNVRDYEAPLFGSRGLFRSPR